MDSNNSSNQRQLQEKIEQKSDASQLKKGFSFKPSRIKEQEDKIKQEEERKRIEKEKKLLQKQQEEERKKQLELEKQKQPIYFQSYQVKRRAADFFSSSSSDSSSNSRSSSIDHEKNKVKKQQKASSSTERKSKNQDKKKEKKVKKKDSDHEESPSIKNQKKERKYSDDEMKESKKKKKQKDKKKKDKQEKKKKKREKELKNQIMNTINNEELDLFYDLKNQEIQRAPEASQKFLYKHVFNRNCLPVSIISFGDKTIPKYMNYGMSGDVPKFKFVNYPMIVGFMRDQESIGLFDDLNQDLGIKTKYSRLNQEKSNQKNNVRYFERRFWEKNEDLESSDFQIQKRVKQNERENALIGSEDFVSFNEDKNILNKLSITFRSEQQMITQSGQNSLNNLNNLSIKDYSDLKDLKIDVEDLTSEEIKLFQQNKEFNQKIKDNPNDPYLWIDYIKLQDQGIKYSSDQFSISSIQQKKIGIIEKALQNEQLSNNIILILYHMRILQDSNQGDDFYKVMNEKWMEYIQKNIYNMLLWNNFLDYRYSNLMKFSATYFRESTAQLLAQLSKLIQQSKSVSEIITLRKIILLIIRKISFIEEQMGFKERSFGILQALIELNVFCPNHIRRCLDHQKRLQEFKNYWEDYYCCKTGEIIGGGWEKQEDIQKLTKEQKELQLNKSFIGKYNDHKEVLLEMDEENWIYVEQQFSEAVWRPANPHYDKDLIKYNSDTIVFSEDVQQFLIVLNDPESQITLINIIFENLGLPPVNDNIFLSTENKAFSTFYFDKSKNLLFQMNQRIQNQSCKINFGSDYKQYCGLDRLDFLNKFFSFSDESFITGGTQSRKNKIIAQLEYVRRLLYELYKKLERESILIYIMWIEGIFFIRKSISQNEPIMTEKQARINIKNLLKNNEKTISLWFIYAEILFEKSIQNLNQTEEEQRKIYKEIDDIFNKVLKASESKEKDRLSVLYFWSSFYLRLVGKVDISFIHSNLLIILQKLKAFTNIKNLILQLHNQMREQIAREKQKLKPELIPIIKTKSQKVFPLSKKSIYAYFLLLAHSIGDTEFTDREIVNYQQYFDLIEETNNEKIKIWDDEELYSRLQRKFQNEMQLLLLNVLRIQKLTKFSSQENNLLTNFDQSRRLQEIKNQQTELYQNIINKYPFFSVAIVELVQFNMNETTRIDRLVTLKQILKQNNFFYSTWMLIIFNEIASAAQAEETEIILSKLRYYFYEAQKDYQLLDKQIALLDKFRNQQIGIDSTTDYFNQIQFQSLFNTFTLYFEPQKLANRSLQSLQQAPFSKEAYLYRLMGSQGDQRQKIREVIVEKEIRIVYNEII
ncbi:NRDE-2 (necessary for RNA interference) protein (macronuclear) [Tetrahymena thermophila SB210]|uniref:NRDE-2 (Necessary for RNA interference) protein n=1 Tax=Tetrahymena thermophila (strain SB210) TaxID=312017 RepID=I7M2R3_TETTS|nr:NRDE-2 (necessary for RNA interference) protein [Tetrahymena thermophila SB210]EAS01145.2 NRDE-2 (necessary for RNA interference) protein [Tetrahymena thermophila SB210]|eukprot:XP_001021390.2 NRDE-2 (necessary for RNA interference) protein [Tetrahymena thermophila SB210]